MRKPKEIQLHYSGPKSERFWRRINAADDYMNLYTLGLVLQETEGRVLRQLENREAQTKRKRQ